MNYKDAIDTKFFGNRKINGYFHSKDIQFKLQQAVTKRQSTCRLIRSFIHFQADNQAILNNLFLQIKTQSMANQSHTSNYQLTKK